MEYNIKNRLLLLDLSLRPSSRIAADPKHSSSNIARLVQSDRASESYELDPRQLDELKAAMRVLRVRASATAIRRSFFMATFAKKSFDAAVYAASRPTYPKALFQFIFNYHERGSAALPGASASQSSNS